MLWEWKLYEYSMNSIIVVQPIDQCFQFVLWSVAGKMMVLGFDPDLLAGLVLGSQVCLRCWIIADQDR